MDPPEPPGKKIGIGNVLQLKQPTLAAFQLLITKLQTGITIVPKQRQREAKRENSVVGLRSVQ